MGYRHKKSVRRSKEEQQYIYAVSRMYQRLHPTQKEEIRALCQEAGGEYCHALFLFVTTDRTATSICMECAVSPATLYRAVTKYYEAFPVPFP